MALTVREGRYPHIKWIDLKSDGTLIECAVLKQDRHGSMFFIEVQKLDSYDKKRLVNILASRNAKNFELWDLMSNVTLRNGVNALKYFHQLVKVITPEGKIMKPALGRQGIQLFDINKSKIPTLADIEMAKGILKTSETNRLEAKMPIKETKVVKKPRTTRTTRTTRARKTA